MARNTREYSTCIPLKMKGNKQFATPQLPHSVPLSDGLSNPHNWPISWTSTSSHRLPMPTLPPGLQAHPLVGSRPESQSELQSELQCESQAGPQFVFQLEFGATSLRPDLQGQSQRGRLSADNQVDLMRWCLSHQEEYADKNTPKSVFWSACTKYIKEEMDILIMHPDRMVKGWELRRRKEIKAEKQRSGIATDDTTWKQQMSLWIEFLDHLKLKEQTLKVSNEASLNSQRQRARKRRRDEMVARLATRQHEESRESDESGEDDLLTENTSDSQLSPTAWPHKRICRKKEREREYIGQAEVLTMALNSFAESLGSILAKSFSRSHSDLETTMNSLRNRQRDLEKSVEQLASYVDDKMGQILDALLELKREGGFNSNSNEI